MKFRFSAALAALLLVVPAFLVQASAATLQGDDRYSAARDAAKAGDRAKFDRIAATLGSPELAPYVDYWRLTIGLENADPAAVGAFLKQNDQTYIAERLRNEWLKEIGKQQGWAAFDAQFPKLLRPDQEVSCYWLQSRYQRGEPGVLDEAMPLWLGLLDPPEACVPVLDALVIEKRVQVDDVWERIRRQFEAGRLTAARLSMSYLPPSQTPDAKTARAVTDSPVSWLAKLPGSALSKPMNRELAALALARLARSDPPMAAERLERMQAQLTDSARAWVWSQIGWRAARNHLDEALGWYRKAGDAKLSEEVSEWKVRAALRAQDWAAVRATIEAMPADLAAEPAWTYWLGRAFRAGGRLDEATALFSKIAGQPNFYGNLADEELGRQTVLPPRAAHATREESALVAANPGLLRALALFDVGLRSEGVREWNWALRGMSDRELLAASEMAERAGVFDRAIAAADRTISEHDYTLRYLSPFIDQVRPAARSQSLDDAWVYGLMRQESRFITNARSTVGASGLMQLMPATARWVAKKIGLEDYHAGKVNDTDTNLLLGTSYMRMVMESLDNQPVLASAAYNAGPGRARRWRADRPLEGAVYAETIPFNETRDYVKKVMSNSLYYAALFEGRPQSIKSRLGMVEARAPADPKAEDLP